MKRPIIDKLVSEVIEPGICTACGACVALTANKRVKMVSTSDGPRPDFSQVDQDLPFLAWKACPGKGIHYPHLSQQHYGQYPKQWLLGIYQRLRIGYSKEETIRKNAASGGVITKVLLHFLEQRYIDAAIVIQQGTPTPDQARVVIVDNRSAIQEAQQSVYIPVSVLDCLRDLDPKKRYAIVCLPDQAAALRVLQQEGFAPALAIHFVLGPYTGTSLLPEAIPTFLRMRGINKHDTIQSLRWRAGNWPGYLEITTTSNIVIRAHKFYYNFLIPFFITQTSLQSMDFYNEFCDLSVGDAWSPEYEKDRSGHSVYITRTIAMETIISNMIAEGKLHGETIELEKAFSMHGHMLDFKKRGSYIRNAMRRSFGKKAPFFGYKPENISLLRWLIEFVILTIFIIGRSRVARCLLCYMPYRPTGYLFDKLRNLWKSLSKPTKRKNLNKLKMIVIEEE